MYTSRLIRAGWGRDLHPEKGFPRRGIEQRETGREGRPPRASLLIACHERVSCVSGKRRGRFFLVCTSWEPNDWYFSIDGSSFPFNTASGKKTIAV